MKSTRSLSHTEWDCKYHIAYTQKDREKALLRRRRKTFCYNTGLTSIYILF